MMIGRERKIVKNTAFSMCVMVGMALFAADPATVKIARFKEVISPEVGAKIFGYDADQVSVTKHGNLTQPIVNIPEAVKYRKVKAVKRAVK